MKQFLPRAVKFVQMLAVLCMVGYHVLHIAAWQSRLDWPNADQANYADVARNILRGYGASQSALGYNQPRGLDGFGTFPSPLEAQPPLFPYAIAGLAGLTGMPVHAAAVLLPAIAFAALCALMYALGAQIDGRPCGLMAAAFGLIAFEARALADGPYSEMTATVLLLAAQLALVRIVQGKGRTATALVCGVLCGLAAATRYALLSLVAFSAAVLIGHWLFKKLGLSMVMAFGAGVSLVAIPLSARNLASFGAMLPSQLASAKGLAENLTAFGVAGGPYVLALLAAVLLAVFVMRYGSASRRIAEVLLYRQAWLPAAWVAMYWLFVVEQRSRIHFENIGLRILFPGTVCLLLVIAVAMRRGLLSQVPAASAVIGAWSCALVFVPYAINYASLPRLTVADVVNQHPPHKWLAQNTTERDLVVCINASKAAFYLDRRHVFSFAHYPYNQRLDYIALQQFLAARCAQLDRAVIYIDFREYAEAPQPETDFGGFVTALAHGETVRYSAIQPLATDSTARYYQLRACP